MTRASPKAGSSRQVLMLFRGHERLLLPVPGQKAAGSDAAVSEGALAWCCQEQEGDGKEQVVSSCASPPISR